MRFIERPKLKFGHAASPVLAGGLLIVHLNDLIALDPKTGREVWRAELPASHATPVVARIGAVDVIVHPSGALVGASDGKILANGLFKANRGSIYQEHLSLGNKVYSGIALAGGLLYLGNEKGKQMVIRPGARYDEVAPNELGELINAAPVFANDRLYLRTEKHLVCIGNP